MQYIKEEIKAHPHCLFFFTKLSQHDTSYIACGTVVWIKEYGTLICQWCPNYGPWGKIQPVVNFFSSPFCTFTIYNTCCLPALYYVLLSYNWWQRRTCPCFPFFVWFVIVNSTFWFMSQSPYEGHLGTHCSCFDPEYADTWLFAFALGFKKQSTWYIK